MKDKRIERIKIQNERMITTSLISKWQGLNYSPEEIGRCLEALACSKQWEKFFMQQPDGSQSPNFDDVPAEYRGMRTGVFYTPETLKSVAYVCCKTLANFLPNWIQSDAPGTEFKMQVDGDVACMLINTENGQKAISTDMTLIRFWKSDVTKSGIYISKIFPIYLA